VNRICFCRPALRSNPDAYPRGRATLLRELEPQECKKTIYADLKHEKRALSDLETFFNPYNSDSSILRCSPKQNETTIIAGIEIETPECPLADRLNEKGTVTNGIFAHLLIFGRKPVFILVFRGLSGLG
jgi:hypothetical protein